MRILVVDDNIDLAAAIADRLQSDAHTVALAHDALSALNQAREHAVDAVVLDLCLPDGNGYDVARELRDSVLAPEAIIILLTGASFLRFDMASAVGVDIVVRKPLDLPNLPQLIAFVCERRHRQLPYCSR